MTRLEVLPTEFPTMEEEVLCLCRFPDHGTEPSTLVDLTLAGCLPRRPSILSGPWSLALGISSAWLLTTSSKNLFLRQSLYDT